jgi:hypothetical protein
MPPTPEVLAEIQADFLVDGADSRNSKTFPRSPRPSHSHPHGQRTDSHNCGFVRSVWHKGHGLVHMQGSTSCRLFMVLLATDPDQPVTLLPAAK